MRRYFKFIIPVAVLGLLGSFLYQPYHRWAREHVNYVTASDDHPLGCASCHLYLKRTGVISKIVNANYYSPFNLAVSNDGRDLYVVAEEGNALLVVDTEKQRVTHKVEVGNTPHGVILSKGGETAYISNQWSDNVSVVDLATFRVIDTLKTGGGPAGLALSTDGKYLYTANSFSSSL